MIAATARTIPKTYASCEMEGHLRADASDDPPWTNATTGIAACCAYAATGHAAAPQSG
jgi:hypothetical protein